MARNSNSFGHNLPGTASDSRWGLSPTRLPLHTSDAVTVQIATWASDPLGSTLDVPMPSSLDLINLLE